MGAYENDLKFKGRRAKECKFNRPKEIEMFTNRSFLKVMPASRAFGMVLILILGIAVTSGIIRIQTDQIIAPRELRVLDWLGKVFVCRCPV